MMVYAFLLSNLAHRWYITKDRYDDVKTARLLLYGTSNRTSEIEVSKVMYFT